MTDGLAARTWADFRSHWREALAFHLLIQLLGAAIFAPVVTWIGQRIVLASGEPVISNFDIAGFVLSPTGAVFVLVIAALTVALMLAEFAGLSFIAECAIARRPVTLASTIAYVVRQLPRLILLSARVFLRVVVLALPFVAAAGLVWLATLRGHDINYYLAEEPPEWRRAKLIAALLLAGYGLLVARQLARWLYAVPILVAAGVSPRQTLADSAAMTRGRIARTVKPLVLGWLLLTVVTVAITWLCRQVSDAGLEWAGLDVHRVLPLVAVCMAVTILGSFLYGGLGLTGHQFFITRGYAEQRAPDRRPAPALTALADERSRLIASPVVLATLVLLALGLGAAALLASRLDLKEDVAITAHRGAKVSAPENTLASFRAALDAGTDYVELDVQHTRDRELVVIHDGDLMRMVGDPRKVGELTLAEIETIDLGRRYDAKFAGERVPTLEQVIELVRGRAKINVELKYNVPDPGLAPAVVDLLRRKDFLDQVVITSLDYAALKDVERLEPRRETGHIVTAAVGNVVRTEADFLSLNSARASASLVRRAHAAGKGVAVWTVNDPEVMLRMIERGVDNVITDDPALLVRVMRDRRTLSKAEILGLRLRVLFSKPPPAVTDPEAVETL
jgi:glycerophosphoryl diester phosphodiesterase